MPLFSTSVFLSALSFKVTSPRSFRRWDRRGTGQIPKIDFRIVADGKAGPVTRALQQEFDTLVAGRHARECNFEPLYLLTPEANNTHKLAALDSLRDSLPKRKSHSPSRVPVDCGMASGNALCFPCRCDPAIAVRYADRRQPTGISLRKSL